jgi:hypothetical protein
MLLEFTVLRFRFNRVIKGSEHNLLVLVMKIQSNSEMLWIQSEITCQWTQSWSLLALLVVTPLLAFGFCAHVPSHGEEQMMNQTTALEMSANIEKKSIWREEQN